MPSSGIVQQLRGVVGHALLHLPAAAGLVLDAEGHLLLIRNVDDGRWAVPGGCIEPGESREDAVKRELNEETGLVVEPLGIVGVFGGPRFRIKYSNGDETSYVSVVFECKAVGGTLRPDGDEASDARYVSWSEVDNMELAPFSAELLAGVRLRLGVPPGRS